eukprot:GHVT01095933.1.p1 GENE.GHVT01095933.1~~GHVT01095933.1.p1  ORF type:complete len:129 (-),score=26.63 GHVT01095933.1:841-1227(-)
MSLPARPEALAVDLGGCRVREAAQANAAGLAVAGVWNARAVFLLGQTPVRSLPSTLGVWLAVSFPLWWVMHNRRAKRSFSLKQLMENPGNAMRFMQMKSLAPPQPSDELTEEGEAEAVRLLQEELRRR